MAVDCKDISIKDDLEIVDGDFNIVDSEALHIETVIKVNTGTFYENPLVGYGIIKQLNGSSSIQEIKQGIRRQLVADENNVKEVVVDNEKIRVNANRLK